MQNPPKRLPLIIRTTNHIPPCQGNPGRNSKSPSSPQFLSRPNSHQTNPPPSRNPPRAIPNHRQRPRSRKTSRSSETKQPFKHVRQTRHNRPPSAPQFLPQNPPPRLRNLPIPLPNRRQILPTRPPHRLPPHRLCAILWQRG